MQPCPEHLALFLNKSTLEHGACVKARKEVHQAGQSNQPIC